MSTVDIRFQVQPLDGGQSVRGVVELELRIEGTVYPLNLTLASVPGFGQFEEIPWDASGTEDARQAEAYGAAFNRDYMTVGNPNPGGATPSDRRNISVSVNGNIVTLDAALGTFHDGAYTGDILEVVAFTINNTTQTTPKTFTYEKTNVGDCNTEEYRATSATGGVGPYRLTFGNTDVFTGWDGASNQLFTLNRGVVYSGALYDANGDIVRTLSIIPSPNLQASDFGITQIPFVGYADLTVNTLTSRNGTTPLEYRIGSGVWGTDNTFGGITPGTYTISIRDVYGCEVSKTVSVLDATGGVAENREDFFTISEYNSLGFYKEVNHSDEVRANYGNTAAGMERVGVPKIIPFSFPNSSKTYTQFFSSFPYHNVTLYRRGLSALPIQIFEIQQNLGVVERVDCKTFAVNESLETIEGTEEQFLGTGIYFDGGQQYEPNTNNPLDDPNSPYTSETALPSWAKTGALVSLDGIGAFTITQSDLYDETRDVSFFLIDAALGETNTIVQAAFDRHPYNAFQFEIPMSSVPEEGAYVRIEPGTDVNNIDQRFVHRSFWFHRISDTSNFIKFKWYAGRNLGNMLFINNIQHELWAKGRIFPFPQGSSETSDADDRTRSVDQQAYLRLRVELPMVSAYHWRKLDLARSIGSRGTFLIQDMEVIGINIPEVELVGDTNTFSVIMEVAFATENTAIAQEDPVIDTGTGLVVPGAPLGSGREPVDNWQISGNRLVDENGEFIKVINNGEEVFIEIP